MSDVDDSLSIHRCGNHSHCGDAATIRQYAFRRAGRATRNSGIKTATKAARQSGAETRATAHKAGRGIRPRAGGRIGRQKRLNTIPPSFGAPQSVSPTVHKAFEKLSRMNRPQPASRKPGAKRLQRTTRTAPAKRETRVLWRKVAVPSDNLARLYVATQRGQVAEIGRFQGRLGFA